MLNVNATILEKVFGDFFKGVTEFPLASYKTELDCYLRKLYVKF